MRNKDCLVNILHGTSHTKLRRLCRCTAALAYSACELMPVAAIKSPFREAENYFGVVEKHKYFLYIAP